MGRNAQIGILLFTLFAGFFPAVVAFADVYLCPGGHLYLEGSGRLYPVAVNPDGPEPEPELSRLTATMTSNTAPSPNEVSSDYSSGDEYKAFDQNLTTYTDTQTNTTGEIIFDFGAGNSETATKLYLKNVANAGADDFTVSGSADGVSYTTLLTDNGPSSDTRTEYAITNSTAYRYYKFAWTTSHSMAWTQIYEIEYWGET